MNRIITSKELKVSELRYQREFEYRPNINLSAAHIGISRWDFTYVLGENESKAKEMMKQDRFDVLPVLNGEGRFESYFRTEVPDQYEHIQLHEITDAETIYYRMSFRDLIKKIKNEQRSFYFLTNYEEVMGMIVLANFNSQLVRNHLYSIISELEQSLCNIFRKELEETEVVAAFASSKDTVTKGIAEKYEKSKKDNVDNDIYELIYLDTINTILKRFKDQLPIDLEEYRTKFAANNLYTNIRNPVMHSVRNLVTCIDSIRDIDEFLNDFDEIKEIIREYLRRE